MEEKKEVNLGGRPFRDFDKKIFEGLCHIQCTVNEIEAVFHANQATIDKWCHRTYEESFQLVYRRYSEGGKASLRRAQMKLAERSPAMAIWLGKVILGQRDMAEVDEKINKALGILDAAKRLRVVDEHANTIAEAAIESKGVECQVQHLDRGSQVGQVVRVSTPV